MPRYDFICEECHKFFSVAISYRDYGKKKVQCPACGSAKTSRRITRVRIARSAENRLEGFSGSSGEAGMDQLEKDPRELGRMMRKMSGEIGEDIGPEFNEVVDRLEHGQSPEDIEKGLPDLDTGAEPDLD
jgi:putative FmdB family regulatory protein